MSLSAHKTTCSTRTRITFIDDPDPDKATLWCLFRKKKTGWDVSVARKEGRGLGFWMNSTEVPTNQDAIDYMNTASEFLGAQLNTDLSTY